MVNLSLRACLQPAVIVVLLLSAGASASPDPLPQEKEKGSVSINHPNTTVVDIPITALLFESSPGTKKCRGRPMLQLNLPKPGSDHTTPICYDLPGPASCAVFSATQADGCEANLFTEPGCKNFVNLGVFVPEPQPMGGYFRSLSIRCGVVGKPPAPLNIPGLTEQVLSGRDKDLEEA